MDIGASIKKIRKEKGLTQVEVAKRAKIAVNSLRMYEAGKRSPNYDQLSSLCNALDIWFTDLFPEDFPVDRNESSAISFERGWIEAQAELREDGYDFSEAEMKLIKNFCKLNVEGRQKAIERVWELTEIPKYQRTGPTEWLEDEEEDTHPTE